MSQTMMMIISAILVTALIILAVRKPSSLAKWISSSIIRISICVLVLYFLNVFGANFGFHLPINIFTVSIGSILGIFGIGALVAAQFILL